MATAYQTPNFYQKQPSGNAHGIAKMTTRLHCLSGTISTWVANDTIAVGYIPKNAIVTGATLKAASQLDSNGSATLALDLGVVGAPQLFKAAVTTVGHAVGASADTTIAAAGLLYQNTSGADQEVICTVHTAAATAVAGTLEFEVGFFVEDAAGSNP